jgi:hypothetical protein
MPTRKFRHPEVKDILAEINPDALLADGFEEALVGYTTNFLPRGHCHPVAVYDREKCIRILVKRDKMSYEDAEECFAFNTDGAFVGEHGPIFVQFHI